MLTSFDTIRTLVTKPSVIADIFTVITCSLVLINNFNKGFITSLLKIMVCYFCAIFLIPFTMGFIEPTTNVPTALIFSIVVFLISSFILTNIVDRLTPDGSYSIIDSVMGLIFGVFEIVLIFTVISSCQIYLKKHQNIDIPDWAQDLDQRNITGALLGIARPYSERFVDYIFSNSGAADLQRRVQKHFGIMKYFKSKSNA